MIFDVADKHFITDSINEFMKNFQRSLAKQDFFDLKTVMEKIELCIDSNLKEDINKKLPVYLTSAKLLIRTIPGSPLKDGAKKVIQTVEVRTPPSAGYFPSKHHSVNTLAQAYPDEPCCEIKCCIS